MTKAEYLLHKKDYEDNQLSAGAFILFQQLYITSLEAQSSASIYKVVVRGLISMIQLKKHTYETSETYDRYAPNITERALRQGCKVEHYQMVNNKWILLNKYE